MISLTALQSFDDQRLGAVKRGANVELPEQVAKIYKLKGLLVEQARPQ